MTIDAIIYAESFFHKRPSQKLDGVHKKRILIMRKDGLGDCIIFYPTLRAYRDYYKNDEITLIFPTYFKDLSPLLGKDLVDIVIWFDHKAFGKSFSYRRKFLLDLKRAGYDVFIYPVYSRETIGYLMMKMTGAHERIGFEEGISERGQKAEKKGTVTFTRLIKVPEHIKKEIDRDVYFAEQVTGQKGGVHFPTIDVKKLPFAEAEALLAQHSFIDKKYIVLFPGAGAFYRIWPLEKFAAIVDYSIHAGLTVVICGSEKEKSLAQKIISLSKSGIRAGAIIDLSGQTDLASLSHILSRARFYFGSDTGILHLAVALGTPAVAIVGAGGLIRFFPYGDPAKNRAVYDKTRSYVTGRWLDAHTLAPGEIHPSIKNITVLDAQKEIDSLLKII
jgi:ADP-heptose:LPS heptosyltransferase